jgi:hypothetical protein
MEMGSSITNRKRTLVRGKEEETFREAKKNFKLSLICLRLIDNYCGFQLKSLEFSKISGEGYGTSNSSMNTVLNLFIYTYTDSIYSSKY